MARFTEKQLEEARNIIRPYVAASHCESFNSKIPLSVLTCSDKFEQVKLFHNNLVAMCHDFFKNFKFKQPITRQYVSQSKKPAMFAIWLNDTMPDIVKYCLKSWENDRFEIVVVYKDTISQYVDVPKHIQKAYDEGKICHADYADYIRIKLLEKYYGIYFDATTLITDNIPDYVIDMPYWSVKGDYQKNTSPIAMLHFAYGQVYALGGFDNKVYSYVRQLLDEYYKHHEYCFSYYMIYYVFEYLYRLDQNINLLFRKLFNNNEDCEQLAYVLDSIKNKSLTVEDFKYKDTFFYKLRSSDEYTQEHYDFFDKLINK